MHFYGKLNYTDAMALITQSLW